MHSRPTTTLSALDCRLYWDKLEIRNDIRPYFFEALMFARSNMAPDVSHSGRAPNLVPVLQEEGGLDLSGKWERLISSVAAQ